jgi:sec-independent protein translocase protein TatA
MPNIGPMELIVVLAIALIFFGPKRLPEMGSSIGKGIREFKSSISGDNDSDDEEIALPQPTATVIKDDAPASLKVPVA